MPITLAAAQQTLRNVVQAGERRVTIEQIVKAVAEKFSLSAAILRQKSSVRQISYPRQIAMYLAKDLTSCSLPEIGRYFGGKHHTTVMHSVDKIDALAKEDRNFQKTVNDLIDSLVS